MVRDLARVDKYEVFARVAHQLLLFGRGEPLRERVSFTLHCVWQVSGIGTRVREKLFFVQVLGAVENLLGAEFKTLVAFFLKFGQIERFLRKLLFLLNVDF